MKGLTPRQIRAANRKRAGQPQLMWGNPAKKCRLKKRHHVAQDTRLPATVIRRAQGRRGRSNPFLR
jgi:hypothetical protein